MGIICRWRKILPSRILINLYLAIVHPYFEYCNTVMGFFTFDSVTKLVYETKESFAPHHKFSLELNSAPIFAK